MKLPDTLKSPEKHVERGAAECTHTMGLSSHWNRVEGQCTRMRTHTAEVTEFH